MYVFDTAMLLYIFKPTIDLNGGGRQGYIVDHSLCEYLRTTNCRTGVRVLARGYLRKTYAACPRKKVSFPCHVP